MAGPRPVAAPEHTAYALLVGVDRPTNSFPSLHAGLSVYSLLFIARVLRDDPLRSLRLAPLRIGVPWIALILYSTLATKQHWAVDLPAGALLAALAHGWVWRGASADS